MPGVRWRRARPRGGRHLRSLSRRVRGIGLRGHSAPRRRPHVGVRDREQHAARGHRAALRGLRPRRRRRPGRDEAAGRDSPGRRSARARLPRRGDDRAVPAVVQAREAVPARLLEAVGRVVRERRRGRLPQARPRRRDVVRTEGTRRPVPRQHRHDRDPSEAGAGDAAARRGAREDSRTGAAVTSSPRTAPTSTGRSSATSTAGTARTSEPTREPCRTSARCTRTDS